MANQYEPPCKATGLGPQCLTCRRRRVKCDSTKPTCQRCRFDEIHCRGYEKRLKVIQFVPTYSTNSTKNCARHGLPKEEANTETSSIRSLSQDIDELAVVDAILSYNNYVAQYSSPLHRPFKRQMIEAGIPWQALPKIVQHTFVVTLRSLQAARNGIDPLSCSDVCYYRGLSLAGLKQYVPGALAEPFGVALGCILLLMGADIHSPTGKSWLFHFQAAGKIISLRNGLQQCIFELPFIRGPLINYLLIDIFTATTCSSAYLFPDIESFNNHIEYVSCLPSLEEDILATTSPCPWAILQAIARTNILRSFNRSWQWTQHSSGRLDEWYRLNEFEQILDAINTFDIISWAAKVLHGQDLPQPLRNCPSHLDISAFTMLGSCYRSASLIYLILSTTYVFDESMFEIVSSAKQSIDEQSCRLFEKAKHDHDGPLHAQLWKFLTWPIIMSTYAHVGWGIGCKQENTDVELVRLRDTASAFKLGRVLRAVDHFRRVQVIKDACGSEPWTWDDGFSNRASFAL